MKDKKFKSGLKQVAKEMVKEYPTASSQTQTTNIKIGKQLYYIILEVRKEKEKCKCCGRDLE